MGGWTDGVMDAVMEGVHGELVRERHNIMVLSRHL